MAKPMKYHPHGSVLFCTFSIEEGLLLLSKALLVRVAFPYSRATFFHYGRATLKSSWLRHAQSETSGAKEKPSCAIRPAISSVCTETS